jgi:hypothetical protein
VFAVSNQIAIWIAQGGAMRLRNFGLMVGGASVVVAIRLAVFTVAGVGLVLAQKDAASKPAVSEMPLTTEQLAVYRAVIQEVLKDVGSRQKVANLAEKTDPADKDFNWDRACGDPLDLAPVAHREIHQFRREDLVQLGSDQFSVTIVNPKKQRREISRNDPQKALLSGKVRTDNDSKRAIDTAFDLSLLWLGEIQFDKLHQHAYTSRTYECGSLCLNGSDVVLVKKNGDWQVEHKCRGVIS